MKTLLRKFVNLSYGNTNSSSMHISNVQMTVLKPEVEQSYFIYILLVSDHPLEIKMSYPVHKTLVISRVRGRSH